MVILVRGFKVSFGLLSCFLGLLALIPIALIQHFIYNEVIPLPVFTGSLGVSLVFLLFKYILVTGLVEEGIKMLLMFVLPVRKNNVKPAEFFCYAVLCGLSLACYESLIYLIGGKNWQMRQFTAVPLHVVCAGLSGLFVYCAKNKVSMFSSFVFAVLFHGVYNYFASRDGFIFAFSIIVLLVAAVECRLRYSAVKEGFAKTNPGSATQYRDDRIDRNVDRGVTSEMSQNKIKGFFGKVLGWFKKDGEAKTVNQNDSLPEQTVFGGHSEDKTVVQEPARETVKTAETVAVTEAKTGGDKTLVDDGSEDAVAEEPKKSFDFSSPLPVITDLFEDDVSSADQVEPDTVSLSEIEEKISEKAEEVEKTVAAVETVAKTVEKADDSAAETAAPKKRGRKPKAAVEAETADETAAPKKRGRKPKAVVEAETGAAEKTAAKKTTTRKAASTTKTSTAKKTTAEKPAEKKTGTKAGTTKAAAEKKTTATKTTAAKKTTAKATATKTTKASTAKTSTAKTTKAAAEKKTTAAKKTAAKSTTAKKTATKSSK